LVSESTNGLEASLANSAGDKSIELSSYTFVLLN
jgi:hypothetical protein